MNVHPTKLEVKFSRDDEVFRALFHAVENALYTIVNVPKIERSEPRYEFERDKASTAAQETIVQNTQQIQPPAEEKAAEGAKSEPPVQ